MSKRPDNLLSVLAISAALSCLTVTSAVAADLDELTQGCANCHGDNGISDESTVPTIAGLSELYLSDNLAIYKDRERPCIEAEYLRGSDKGSKTDMCKIADKLADEDIEALAKFFSGKKFVAAKQSFDSEGAARGKKLHKSNCEKCHADGGSSAEDDTGILAGQWTHYLEQSFKTYDSGEREMPKKMKRKYKKLSAEDKQDLLHFYASQQ